MIVLFTAASALAPSILLVWYFHKRDLYPEPPRVLWATFGLGVLTVIPVIPIEMAIDSLVASTPSPIGQGFFSAFFTAALTEELFKFAVLMGYCYRHPEFNEPMDGIIYGVVASLGFATFENILYVSPGGLGVAVMRALTSVPSHATEGAIMGYFVGRAKFAPTGRTGLILKGLFAAIILHGLYDFPLLSLTACQAAKVESNTALMLTPITIGALLTSVILAVRYTRRVRAEQIAQGLLPPPLPAEARAMEQRSQGWGVVMIVAGFVMGGGGGIMMLLLMVAFGTGAVEGQDAMAVLAGGVILGVAPLLAGLLLLVFGIKRLNHPERGHLRNYPRASL